MQFLVHQMREKRGLSSQTAERRVGKDIEQFVDKTPMNLHQIVTTYGEDT